MLTELIKKRAAAFDAFKAIAEKETLTAEEQTDYSTAKRAVEDLDGQIQRARDAQALSAATAEPVAGQEQRAAATVETSPYVSDAAAKHLAETRGCLAGSARSIVFGGMIQMAAAGDGNLFLARQASLETYGEAHPVTRALVTSVGASGGFVVPPDYMNEVIELLRAETVVRPAGPRVIPMPRGTMTLPGQSSAATASYGNEQSAIGASQPGLNQIVASFKKLMALVPVSNDMMRYSDPAIDAFVRDDLVQVMGLAEDGAFMFGQGTSDTPMGFLTFANRWVSRQNGTVGNWLTSAASTPAANGADTPNTTGGNFITSNPAYTLASAGAELGGAVNRLDAANVRGRKRVWFMNPRSYNYLYNVQNSLGIYAYRDELSKGALLGYPVRTTTQIGTGYWDAAGSNKDLSFIFLVEMTEAMILDSMSLELAVSREGTYVDAGGVTRSAFQADQTLIRAITEHDFQMRHDQGLSVIQGVRWAPAIS